MTSAIPSFLERIVAHKRQELAAARIPREVLESQARSEISSRRDFEGSLLRNAPSVISELKQASPSKGVLTTAYAPARIAAAYERGGAAALSVLTDREFFGGSLEHLETARAATRVPVLRKDFTIDPYHVVEAAAHGADAILLIAAILPDRDLRDYRELAETYRMAALVEVHDELELERAAASGARVIGVNNRDLRSFEVRIETSLRLAAKMPPGTIAVSESGIRSAAQVRELLAAGYHAFLVGEHFMTSPDPAAAVRDLITWS
jgi:indole-3-glycerol phosphate synthase